MLERKRTFYLRRGIFLLTAIAVIVPLLLPLRLPMIVAPPVQNLYDAVEQVPPDKIIVLSTNWEAGAKGENGPQTAALIYHLMKRGKRFAIWGWNYPQGPELAQVIAEPLARKYHRQYGVDWVNWGFKTGGTQMIRGWAENIWGAIKEDRKGTPMKNLPIMQNVHSYKDIGLIIEITPAASLGVYIQFLKGVHNVSIGYACTAVMAAEAYPYLDSKQIVGMLAGLAGAAGYEELEGYNGDGTRRMTAQSFAHIFIILLIILGNIGYFLGRRKPAPSEKSVSS
jgi:hypothetical protein